MGSSGRIQWVAHLEGSGQEGKTHPGLSFDSWGVVADDEGSRCRAGHVTESYPDFLHQSSQLRPVPHQSPIRIEALAHALTERHSGPCLWAVLLAVLLVTMIAWPAAAAEGKRVAFVVGIGTYDNLSADKQLRNAVNDADGVSAKLTEIGFQVTKASNLTRPAFNAKWQHVLDSLTTEDTFVLFFSGHGVQIEGENHLLPRDIPFMEFGKQERLKRESISVNELLGDLTTGSRAHPKRAVVILDACRDNPLIPPGYKSFRTPSGLAKPSSTEGLFVIYAAVENSVSLDRLPSDEKSVKYSVFTRALLPLLTQPLTLQDLSVELKKNVLALTKRAQRPSYYDGTDGEPFCFPGCTVQVEKGPAESKPNRTTTVNSTLSKELTGKEGAPMVLVPAGEFMMGSREDDKMAGNDERPAHSVYLNAYYIDQYEVTTSHYETFFKAMNREMPRYWPVAALDELGRKPVVGVDWNGANEYCSWAGKRLPTEAEWEKAARGADRRLYPWGNEAPDNTRAHFSKVELSFKYGVFPDVGSLEAGKSPFGAYDMAGNVSEWVADWYGENYYAKSPARNPKGPSNGAYRVLRGGSWGSGPVDVRSAVRYSYIPTARYDTVGFRCAQDAQK